MIDKQKILSELTNPKNIKEDEYLSMSQEAWAAHLSRQLNKLDTPQETC
jgi:hypothetical protein